MRLTNLYTFRKKNYIGTEHVAHLCRHFISFTRTDGNDNELFISLNVMYWHSFVHVLYLFTDAYGTAVWLYHTAEYTYALVLVLQLTHFTQYTHIHTHKAEQENGKPFLSHRACSIQ